MKILILRSPQIPIEEHLYYIGSAADDADAHRQLREAGFQRHGTISDRWQVNCEGREWVAQFYDVGDLAIQFHLRNARPVH